ncbi:MAG: hypothetical protein H6Q05_785 [Acidobacteria bacterium]|nr:hypothetical protein [Acidobacteriota bacterium]
MVRPVHRHGKLSRVVGPGGMARDPAGSLYPNLPY